MVGTRIPPALHDALRRRAVDEDRSVSAVIRAAIRAYLGDVDR